MQKEKNEGKATVRALCQERGKRIVTLPKLRAGILCQTNDSPRRRLIFYLDFEIQKLKRCFSKNREPIMHRKQIKLF